MKLLIAIIISFIFLSKSIFAVTWDEVRNVALPFLKTVTELSALLLFVKNMIYQSKL